MTIPIPLITAGINLVSKVVSAISGDGNGNGGQQAAQATADGGGFKDAMKLVGLAKEIGKFLSPGDQEKLNKLMASGEFKDALGMLQGLLAQLQTASATSPTPTAAVPAGAQTANPSQRFLKLDADSLTGMKGYTTNGNAGDLLGVAAPTTVAPPAEGTVVNPTAQQQPDVLAGLVGAGKTKPAPTFMDVALTVKPPVAPPPVDTAQMAMQALAPADAEVPIPDANAVNPGTGQAACDVPDLVSIQVQGGSTNGAGAQSQESFFLLNSLKRELRGKEGGVAELNGVERSTTLAPPGLTYEASKLTAAQIDLAMAPRVDTQKLIDQIMDGVFKPPVQLPATVKLNLNPAHLGPLQVQVSMHDDGVRVQMITPNAHVKAALEQGINDLRTAMANQGLQLGHMGVDVRQDGSGQRFAQQQQQQRANRLALERRGFDDGLTAVEAATGPPLPNRMAALAGAMNAYA